MPPRCATALPAWGGVAVPSPCPGTQLAPPLFVSFRPLPGEQQSGSLDREGKARFGRTGAGELLVKSLSPRGGPCLHLHSRPSALRTLPRGLAMYAVPNTSARCVVEFPVGCCRTLTLGCQSLVNMRPSMQPHTQAAPPRSQPWAERLLGKSDTHFLNRSMWLVLGMQKFK